MWALAHGDVTMEKFLHEYGYQGNRAADLYATVWREDPGLLWPLLDAMASMPEPDGPEATGRARVQDRVDAERELLDALRGEARDAAVQAIADARRFTVLREHVKVVSQRSLDVARAAARTMGRSLADRGLLDDPEDVSISWPPSSSPAEAPDLRERSYPRAWRRSTRPSTYR